MANSDIGTRMKEYYEQRADIRLMRRCPVIIRVDGKAFRTFTKGLNVPFDDILIGSMQSTAKYLCKSIQGVKLAYTQSDEISLLLVDYENLESDAWYDNRVQKLCSVSASMATLAFNKVFRERALKNTNLSNYSALAKCVVNGAMFDSHVFNIPKEEVTNYFYWRQLDAMRNSVRMVGRSVMKESELQGMSTEDVKDSLIKLGVDWNDFELYKQRGSCVVKRIDAESGLSSWVNDLSIPLFKGDGREYIESLVYVGD